MTDIPTIQLECKKDSIKQLQNGDGKLTLTVNAEDMNAAIASLWAAPMGTRYQVVMVEIGDDEQPRERPAEPPAKAKPPMTESQRCGMHCQQEDFQQWLAESFPKKWEFFFTDQAKPDDAAACLVRHMLGIRSRKELDDPAKPGTRTSWQMMLAQFEADTGRMAERTR